MDKVVIRLELLKLEGLGLFQVETLQELSQNSPFSSVFILCVARIRAGYVDETGKSEVFDPNQEDRDASVLKSSQTFSKGVSVPSA